VEAASATRLADVKAASQAELERHTGEIVTLRDEVGRVQAEKASLEQVLGHATKALSDLRESRGYRLMRRLGRWGSLERGIRRVLS
jgi:hypothetical protein